jgi:hypothetical protein
VAVANALPLEVQIGEAWEAPPVISWSMGQDHRRGLTLMVTIQWPDAGVCWLVPIEAPVRIAWPDRPYRGTIQRIVLVQLQNWASTPLGITTALVGRTAPAPLRTIKRYELLIAEELPGTAEEERGA